MTDQGQPLPGLKPALAGWGTAQAGEVPSEAASTPGTAAQVTAVLPGCVRDCACARSYGRDHVMQAPGVRLLVSAAALRPGDCYLVVRPGRIVEALITALWIPPTTDYVNGACNRAGTRTLDGRDEAFWVDHGYVVVTRRDPAYKGWIPGQGAAPWPPAPADALAFSPPRFASAFRYGNSTAPYEAGTRETTGGKPDWARLHAENSHEDAGWDNFGRKPGDGQAPYFPWLVVAQTACLAEDLGQDDELRPVGPLDSFIPRYKCRLGHIHRGESPYGRELPPGAAARISASLGEELPDGTGAAR